MSLFKQVATDRIAAGLACSYGLSWAVALGVAIFDRISFRPNVVYYAAAACALFYISASIIALFRIKGSTRLLQVATVIGTLLLLTASCVLFYSERSLIGRGLLVAFVQLQIVYTFVVCLLLERKTEE